MEMRRTNNRTPQVCYSTTESKLFLEIRDMSCQGNPGRRGFLTAGAFGGLVFLATALVDAAVRCRTKALRLH